MAKIGTVDPRYVRAWADAYGFPDTYTAVDCETSGLDVARDYMVQLGWCSVANRNATYNVARVINHPANLSRDLVTVLRIRLDFTRAAMARKKAMYPWTIEMMRDTGELPQVVAGEFLKVCDPAEYMVAHYGTAFDFSMIDTFMRAQVEQGLPDLATGRLIDTAMIVKAGLLQLAPRRGESMASFVARLHAARSAPAFGMSACITMFDLAGGAAQSRHAHDAGYDAWLTHLLLEKLRQCAAGG